MTKKELKQMINESVQDVIEKMELNEMRVGFSPEEEKEIQRRDSYTYDDIVNGLKETIEMTRDFGLAATDIYTNPKDPQFQEKTKWKHNIWKMEELRSLLRKIVIQAQWNIDTIDTHHFGWVRNAKPYNKIEDWSATDKTHY